MKTNTLIKKEKTKYKQREVKGKKFRKEIQKVMPDKYIDKIISNEIKAYKYMAKKADSKSLPTMINIFFVRENEVGRGLIQTSIIGEDRDERVRNLLKIGVKLGEEVKDVLLGAMMATEAWYVKGEKDGKLPDKRPSECKNREEAVIIAFESVDHRQASAIVPIKRLKDQTISLTTKPTISKTGEEGTGMYNDMLYYFMKGVLIGQARRETAK